MKSQESGNGFLTGAIIGGVLGGAIGLLTAPKSGKELMDDLNEGYSKFTKNASDIKDQIRDKGYHLLHLSEEEAEEEEGESSNISTFLIGSAVGATIGAVAAFMLAPQSGSKLRQNLNDKYEEIYDKAEDFVSDINKKGHGAIEQLDDWKDTVGKIINKIGSKGRKQSHSKANDIMEWAGLGLHLYQQLQKRR